ncbi:hypothetical protein AB0C27_40720 [Nonomuraea sp. NPDC048882]|uniref:hypothetical protein n=1 Tax=Nonomuraea sp. NPDC048882 TaxID=3154347 RepID=UPI0033F57470
MTITAIASHTVGIEPITADTRLYVPTPATRAVVERYDGRLVKVIATDADAERTASTLEEYAQAAAHAYGADYVPALTIPDMAVNEVLLKMEALIRGPYNATLPEALHLSTRNPGTARQAMRQLADTLRLHPRDLALWGATRARDEIVAVLRLAAGMPR